MVGKRSQVSPGDVVGGFQSVLYVPGALLGVPGTPLGGPWGPLGGPWAA